MARRSVNKRRSSSKFRSQVRRTKPQNLRGPARGGTRL